MKLLNAFRYLTLFFSLLGLASHFAQCTLLTVYQKQTAIPDWLSGGHWQYLIIYITFGLSVPSAIMLCVHATCCKRAHVVRGDRTLGTFNAALSMAVLFVITFVDSQEPWTDNIVEFKFPAKGFVPYCSLLDQAHDATYPLLFQRCLLFNCTYILLGVLSLFWISLVIIACVTWPRSKHHTSKTLLPSTCTKQIRPIYNHMDFQYADHPVPNTAQGPPSLVMPDNYYDSTVLQRHHHPDYMVNRF